jgi:hypothetical protein
VNPKIRAAIVKLYDKYVVLVPEGIVALLGREGINTLDAHRTIHLMKDAGELVSDGQVSLRLSLKFVEAQAPITVRAQKYMRDNWIAIAALVLALIALFKH